jgi:hypothetical protein
MQQHEDRQDIGVDGRILQDRGMDQCRSRIFKKDLGVRFVEITASASESPNHDEIGDQQEQKRSVDFRGSPQRPRRYS